MWTQIVGKIRLAQAPMVNHWWQVTLYVTPRGLTTSADPDGDRVLRDRVRLLRPSSSGSPGRAAASTGRSRSSRRRSPSSTPRRWPRSPSSGIDVAIWPAGRGRARRSRSPRTPSTPPTTPAAAQLFWRQLVQADRVMTSSAPASSARSARCTSSGAPSTWPCTRFSGPPRAGASRRRAQLRRLGDGRGLLPRARSCGFWPGGGEEGAFYAYAYPEPDGFSDRAGQPSRGRPTAPDAGQFLLPYEAVRTAPGPGRDAAGVPADHLRGGRRPRRLGPRHARLLAGPAGLTEQRSR